MSAPRIRVVPDGRPHPDGDAVLELVEACGIRLMGWQEDVLRASLLRGDDGRWAAMDTGLMVPRQNGKSELVLARLLGGLFVLGEEFLVYTAHLADTAKEMFRRLDDTIESKPWLAREVGHVWRTNGHEAIELRDGRRVRFRTRTKGGGRGFANVSFVAFDEAMDIPVASHSSILPIISASQAPAGPQVWYLGSAVDQLKHEDGVVFAKVRERALEGRQRICYFEWSPGYGSPELVPAELAADPAVWAANNPSLGLVLDEGSVENEHESMIPREFAIERLGEGDWPRTTVDADRKIELAVWRKLKDARSSISGGLCLAFDVSPERSAAIAVAGFREDGKVHVEVVDHRAGTRWLGARLAQLVEDHDPAATVCDARGPAGSILDALAELGVKVEEATASEHARGCGQLVDLVDADEVRHLGQGELEAAVAGAATRPLGEAWAWARQGSGVDISPLVAVTLAVWGLQAFGKSSEPMFGWR